MAASLSELDPSLMFMFDTPNLGGDWGLPVIEGSIQVK